MSAAPEKHPRLFTKQSIWTGKTHEMVVWVTDDQFAELGSPRRRHIQLILPEATSEEREFLISGMSPQEQHEFYGQES